MARSGQWRPSVSRIPKGKVRVVGFDGAPNALTLLKDGWIQADVGQMLYREGYEGVRTAMAAAKGEPVPARIDTGYRSSHPKISTASSLTASSPTSCADTGVRFGKRRGGPASLHPALPS